MCYKLAGISNTWRRSQRKAPSNPGGTEVLTNWWWMFIVQSWETFISLIFPYIGNVIIPTDELHHFSEGLAATANQIWRLNTYWLTGFCVYSWSTHTQGIDFFFIDWVNSGGFHLTNHPISVKGSMIFAATVFLWGKKRKNADVQQAAEGWV